MGKKADELLERLQTEGIKIQDAPILLRAVEEELAREKAPQINPRQFNDPQAQRLSDLWFAQRSTMTVKQKDQIGLAYISKVLGLGDEVSHRFAVGDQTAYHEVGLKQGGEEGKFVDIKEFWKMVVEMFPADYNERDVSVLEEKCCNRSSVLHFIFQIEIMLAEESPVLRELGINAHVYK